MTAPTLYHLDSSGAFSGRTSLARHSPADEEEVWLIPKGATTEEPPVAAPRQMPVWRDNAWSLVPDHRGQFAYNKATGVARGVEEPGELGAGETLVRPPSPEHVWTGDAWQLPLAQAKVAKLGEVAAELARRQAAGFTYLNMVYQIDEASQGRIAALAMRRIASSPAGPARPGARASGSSWPTTRARHSAPLSSGRSPTPHRMPSSRCVNTRETSRMQYSRREMPRLWR